MWNVACWRLFSIFSHIPLARDILLPSKILSVLTLKLFKIIIIIIIIAEVHREFNEELIDHHVYKMNFIKY